MLDGGCFYPPTDYDKWGALVKAWATHVKERYPDAESNWQWELWNEPDIDYWQGTSPWCLVGGLTLGVIVGFYELVKTTWPK